MKAPRGESSGGETSEGENLLNPCKISPYVFSAWQKLSWTTDIFQRLLKSPCISMHRSGLSDLIATSMKLLSVFSNPFVGHC